MYWYRFHKQRVSVARKAAVKIVLPLVAVFHVKDLAATATDAQPDKLSQRVLQSSHRRHVGLDCTTLGKAKSESNKTYRTWQEIESKRRQERIESGDRGHPELRLLDELESSLTYPGWHLDVADAERYHIKLTGRYTFTERLLNPFNWFLENDYEPRGLFAYGRKTFDDKIEEISRKQRIHDGDRGSWELRALDEIKPSYPGWYRDAAEVERLHLWGGEDRKVKIKLEQMRKAQRLHVGDRTHPELRALDSIQPSYPGWQRDVARVESLHRWAARDRLKKSLDEMRMKQRLHLRDRN